LDDAPHLPILQRLSPILYEILALLVYSIVVPYTTFALLAVSRPQIGSPAWIWAALGVGWMTALAVGEYWRLYTSILWKVTAVAFALSVGLLLTLTRDFLSKRHGATNVALWVGIYVVFLILASVVLTTSFLAAGYHIGAPREEHP